VKQVIVTERFLMDNYEDVHKRTRSMQGGKQSPFWFHVDHKRVASTDSSHQISFSSTMSTLQEWQLVWTQSLLLKPHGPTQLCNHAVGVLELAHLI